MRRLVTVLGFVLVPVLLSAQATRVTTSGTLPATCVQGNVYFKTGTGVGFYVCTATNTWSGPYSSEALPATTADAVPVGDGSDFQARVLPSCSNGTSSKLLYNSSTDSFSCGTDQGGGGTGTGGWVLVEQHTASASASLDFTACFTSTYDEYEIRFIRLIPATDAQALHLRVTTNGGSSYDSSSLYFQSNYGVTHNAGAGSSGNTIAAPAGQFYVVGPAAGDVVDDNTNYGVSGHLVFVDPIGTAGYKEIWGDITARLNSNLQLRSVIGGGYQSATAVNGFQVYFASGNIASGTVRCYGIVK